MGIGVLKVLGKILGEGVDLREGVEESPMEEVGRSGRVTEGVVVLREGEVVTL